MITAKNVGQDADVDRWLVQGTLANGNAVNAVLETERDGREAWWDEDTAPCETGGCEPGFDDTGWDEILQKLT